MTLTPEQSTAVSTWIAAGDNLSVVQTKLREQFQLSLTYMDVRFLVDDLNLALKDAPPRADASDVSKAPAQPAPTGADADDGLPAEDADAALADDDAAAIGGNVRVSVDAKTLIPGAVASGSVTFSDGVTGQWIVDQYGRPGFTKISKSGYQPSPADAQAFMRELNQQLQKKGY